MPLLKEKRVCAQEPEVHYGREDSANADADKNETVVRNGKMARADENHRKCLEHWAKRYQP